MKLSRRHFLKLSSVTLAGVAAAALIFLLAVGLLLAFMVTRHERGTHYVINGEFGPDMEPIVQMAYDGDHQGVVQYFASDDDADADPILVSTNASVTHIGHQGRVLVINHGDADDNGLRWLMNRLQTLGYDLFGNGDSEAEIDLQARVLHEALKGYDIDAPEVSDMLRSWLVATDADFDFALVVSPDHGEPVRLVRGGGTTRDEAQMLVDSISN